MEVSLLSREVLTIGGALSRETQLFMSTVLAPIIQGRLLIYQSNGTYDRLWPHRDMWNDDHQYAGLQKAWDSRRTRSLNRMQTPRYVLLVVRGKTDGRCT